MTVSEQEIDFLTYCKLAANVYPDGKDDHNLLSSASGNWQKMPLSMQGAKRNVCTINKKL